MIHFPPLPTQTLSRYGFLGLPLAFAALPIYVQAPHYYAEQFGLSLATLGLMLLAVRSLDAIADPWIGKWVDRRGMDTASARFITTLTLAAIVLVMGFWGLWFPPLSLGIAIEGWLMATLLLTFGGYSVLSIAHAAWGANLAKNATHRHLVVSWREGFGLIGVLLASVLPLLIGFGWTTAILAGLLILSLGLLPPPPVSSIPEIVTSVNHSWLSNSPWTSLPFRWFMVILVINGMASAFPATLLPFFVADRLQEPTMLGVYLLLYFLSAGLSLPAWNRAVHHWGLVRVWQLGMILAIVAFLGVSWIQSGDGAWFAVVCILTGAAFGADLTAPPAILAGIIHNDNTRPTQTAVFFGWWACANKMNLALAAGVALPLLQWLGYAVGTQASEPLFMLTLVYSVFPCLMKAIALLALFCVSAHFGPSHE
jgi:GPH family glycoside/pentoside/hexuronide:cation symporter